MSGTSPNLLPRRGFFAVTIADLRSSSSVAAATGAFFPARTIAGTFSAAACALRFRARFGRWHVGDDDHRQQLGHFRPPALPHAAGQKAHRDSDDGAPSPPRSRRRTSRPALAWLGPLRWQAPLPPSMHLAANATCIKAVWLAAWPSPSYRAGRSAPGGHSRANPQGTDLSRLLGSVRADFAEIGSLLRPSHHSPRHAALSRAIKPRRRRPSSARRTSAVVSAAWLAC